MPKPYYHDEKSGITIYNADCREILPFIGEFDLCLTDPPYGIGVTKMQLGDRVAKPLYRGSQEWDNAPITTALSRRFAPCHAVRLFGAEITLTFHQRDHGWCGIR